MGFLEQQLAPIREVELTESSWGFVEKVSSGTRSLLDMVIDRYSILDSQPPDELPDNIRQQAVNLLTSLQHYLPRDDSIDPANATFRETITGFRSQLDELWRFWKNEARGVTRADETRAAALVAAAEAAVERTEVARMAAEKVAVELRDLAAEAGALELSQSYNDRATAHRRTAQRALALVVGLSVLLVFGGFFLISDLPHTTEWIVLARDVLARGFAIGALTYLITFSARVYRTNTHLTSVYEQKVSALKTFGAFQSAVEGEEARALLLTELVHAVFASADTGVFAKDGDTTTIVDAAAPIVAALTRGK